MLTTANLSAQHFFSPGRTFTRSLYILTVLQDSISSSSSAAAAYKTLQMVSLLPHLLHVLLEQSGRDHCVNHSTYSLDFHLKSFFSPKMFHPLSRSEIA